MIVVPIRGGYLLRFYALLFSGIALVTGGVAWVVVSAPAVPELAIVVGAGMLAVGVALGTAPAAAMWERMAARRGPFVEWDETRISGPGGWSIDLRQEYRRWIGFNEYEVRTVRFRTVAMAVFCRLEQSGTVVTLLATEGTEAARAMGLEQSVLPDERKPEVLVWSGDLLPIIRQVQKR